MHVDFPEPDEPTRATVCPHLTLNDRLVKTGTSCRDGYEKLTLEK
jgi:hypothetical protein